MCVHVSIQTRFILIFFEVMTDNFHLLLVLIYSYTPGQVTKRSVECPEL